MFNDSARRGDSKEGLGEDGDADDEAELRDANEGFRGGRGGALGADTALALGGDSRLMSGAPFIEWFFRDSDTCCVGVRLSPEPLTCFVPLKRSAGPSSTTQSLRSMREVFRPKLGGEGEGDVDLLLGDVDGKIRGTGKLAAEGVRGVSRRLSIGRYFAGFRGRFLGELDGPARDSKALILD